MKKKLLFVMPGLHAGGGEKSLVNLLGVIDRERYDVDVMLFHKTGIFLKMVPDYVKVMEISGDYRIFSKGLMSSVVSFLLGFKWQLVTDRIAFAMKNKKISNKSAAEQFSWKNAGRAIPVADKEYDVAVGFLEKSSVYYVVDKVRAKKKIGWIHTNYSSSGMQSGFDAPYFKQLGHIVTVSDECAAALGQSFPALQQKIAVIHNIVSEKLVRKLADTGDAAGMNFPGTTILSVGRLSTEKGFDLAVDACEILVRNGVEVNWYVIGDGRERNALAQQIEDRGLQGKFHLLGAKENPYPYLKKASVYVQPSRYEGKSIAIDEAKMLHKPIVATRFTTVKDQISDGVNGLVAEMSPEGIANEIRKIVTDKSLAEKLSAALREEHISSESEIEKLYALIER
jgi:glycosyltransferase involved in cell wall biosynthesis